MQDDVAISRASERGQLTQKLCIYGLSFYSSDTWPFCNLWACTVLPPSSSLQVLQKWEFTRPHEEKYLNVLSPLFLVTTCYRRVTVRWKVCLLGFHFLLFNSTEPWVILIEDAEQVGSFCSGMIVFICCFVSTHSMLALVAHSFISIALHFFRVFTIYGYLLKWEVGRIRNPNSPLLLCAHRSPSEVFFRGGTMIWKKTDFFLVF